MSARVNRQWRLAARPQGAFKASDFQWAEEPARAPAEGEVLVRSVYLSLDPTQRNWANEQASYLPPVGLGEVMRGGAIGVVEESRDPAFEPGDRVQGLLGWQSYATVPARALTALPPIPGLPLDAYFGLLGHIGATAYFGLLDVGKARAGETLVVSAAAGAVGSLVGQIGRIQGCRVVGIAGSAEKCRWLTRDLGFDAAIDYKHESVPERLRETCPNGVDVYFDNVGGEILDWVLARINLRARIVVCGLISTYNATGPVVGPANFRNILVQRARAEGFIVLDYLPRFAEAVAALAGWYAAGQIRYRVDVVEGLENAPAALHRLFDGSNTGKLMVKISDPPA